MPASVKVTFTLDKATIKRLREAAARLKKPQSEIVRDAIADFSARVGRLGEAERLRLLRDFDELVAAIPCRPEAAVARELRELLRGRRLASRPGRARACSSSSPLRSST